jgi:hypothetical protein
MLAGRNVEAARSNGVGKDRAKKKEKHSRAIRARVLVSRANVPAQKAMDLIIMVDPRGFTLGVDSLGRRSSCDGDVAIFPRMGWHADEVLSALVHDDTETIQAPLSVVLAKVAQLIATHGTSEASELGEPSPRAAPSTGSMDLLIVWLPHCHALKVGSGSGREWRGRADLVAVFPGAGWCQTEVQNAFSRNEWSPIQAHLSPACWPWWHSCFQPTARSM